MPWKETNVMNLRMLFVSEARLALMPFSDLCRKFAISRKTGYKWLDRYDTGGRPALGDRSRAPHHCPHKIPEAVAQLLLAARASRTSV